MSDLSTRGALPIIEPSLGAGKSHVQTWKPTTRWARARAIAWDFANAVAWILLVCAAAFGTISACNDFLQEKVRNSEAPAPSESARGAVEEMKAEQAWLVKEKLGTARPIEFATYETNGHMSQRRGEDGALVFVIVAGGQGWDKAAPWSTAAQPRYVYRHEEGHAEMIQMAVSAKSAANVARGWRAEVASMTNRAAILGQLIGREQGVPWRSTLLKTLREEAFADAYACLSIARLGQEKLRECAMMVHAMRIFPSAASENGDVSLSVKGGDHNVDMASFMSGQLRAADVGALDRSGLLELAARIADESVAWSVARNAKGLGSSTLFNEEGREWWAQLVRKNGLSRKEADKLFDEWKKEAQSDYPSAAFGSVSWIVQGRTFKVDKLPQSVRSARWRFEGFGGMITSAAWSDPFLSRASSGRASQKTIDASASASASASAVYSAPTADGRSVCVQAPEKCWDGRADGYKVPVDLGREGALDAHFALADKLGASRAEESARLKELVGGERFLVGAIDRRMSKFKGR